MGSLRPGSLQNLRCVYVCVCVVLRVCDNSTVEPATMVTFGTGLRGKCPFNGLLKHFGWLLVGDLKVVVVNLLTTCIQ